MEIKINHLQHIGIPVSDLNVSEAFYRKLGFESATSSTFRHHGNEGRMVMMKLKDIIIELYQLPEDDLAEIRSRKDGHIDHITFDVSDIDQTYNALTEASFQVLEDQPVFSAVLGKGL